MNKGFILDGYPRNFEDAKAVFLHPIPGFESQQEDGAEAEENKEEDANAFPGLIPDERIFP